MLFLAPSLIKLTGLVRHTEDITDTDSHCGGIKFNQTFDDANIVMAFQDLAGNQSYPGAAFWKDLIFPSGWAYSANDMSFLHPLPNSAPVMLVHSPQANSSADQTASIESMRPDTFNIYGAQLGCLDDRRSEDDCHVTIYGYRHGVQVAKKDLQHVPSCGNNCNMRRIDLPTFTNLTSIGFRAKDDGKPRMFFLDDLEMSWNTPCPEAQPSAPSTDSDEAIRQIHNITIDFEDSTFPHDSYMGLRWSNGFHVSLLIQ